MDETALLEAIELGEDSKRQFKEKISSTTSLAQEMVAFSNSGGGQIFVGVRDNDGSITGLTPEQVRETNQWISNAASNLVRPEIDPHTENIRTKSGIVVIVSVPEGVNSPYSDNKGIYWIKRGADKRNASREELQRMFRRAGAFHADEMLVPHSSIEDLDRGYFNDFYLQVYEEDATQLNFQQLLQDLDLLRDGQVTVAGLLLFGKRPQIKLPNFIVRAIAYSGVDIEDQDYLDNEDIFGRLEDIFRKSIGFVLRQLHRRQAGQEFNSPGKLEIPELVFKELIANALLHRDYFSSAQINLLVFKDRVEIVSPGHLPNHLTVEQIQRKIFYHRNPVLDSLAKAGRIVPYQGVGSGISRTIKAWQKIHFEDDRDGNQFRVFIERERLFLTHQRVIFLGHGEVGKTSLIRTLFGEPVVEGKEKMTPGIEIRKWEVPETEVQAHFWDFGGQVMAHATHQFFMRERCLYIIVLSARDEINANEQAEYWLQHVKAFGSDAKVMLVGNKYDLMPLNLDMHMLHRKYLNIVGFYPLSCTEYKEAFKSQFKVFRDALIAQLNDASLNRLSLTETQFRIMQQLEQLSEHEPFLEKEKFKEICVEHGLTDEQTTRDYLNLLDTLGVVLHFRTIGELDSFVLNPRWITYGAYTVLYSEHAKKKGGRILRNDVFKILQEKPVQDDETGRILNYEEGDKIGFLIRAMEQFKVCYPVGQEELVFPALLSANQPKFEWNEIGALQFEFQFEGFLPRHVMPSLIVQFHNEIKSEIVWQNGVWLYNGTHRADALIMVDCQLDRLILMVKGVGAKEYLEILLHAAREIIQTMEGLTVREWIVLPQEAKAGDSIGHNKIEKAPYQQVIAHSKQGIEKYISESGTVYSIGKIIGIIGIVMSEKEQKNAGIHINSSGSGDVKVVVGADGKIDSENVDISIQQAAEQLNQQLNNQFGALISANELEMAQEIQQLREQLEKLEANQATSEEKQGIRVSLQNMKEKFGNLVDTIGGLDSSISMAERLLNMLG